MFFTAGLKLSKSATDLTELKSVGGESVAEAYYQEIGHQGLAYSRMLYGCGFGIIVISLGFGGLLLSNNEAQSRN